MTLAFSAVTALGAAALNLPHPGLLLTLAGYFGLLYLTARFRNSSTGLLMVFALTGFMGLTLGPILNAYLAMSGGPSIVATAMGTTAVVFLGLSAYARTAPVGNLPKFGTFLFVGILTAFVLGLAAPIVLLFAAGSMGGALQAVLLVVAMAAGLLGLN